MIYQALQYFPYKSSSLVISLGSILRNTIMGQKFLGHFEGAWQKAAGTEDVNSEVAGVAGLEV